MANTTIETITSSAEETKKVGGLLARFLKKGDVVLLIAGLGSGKTTLVQGLAQKKGVKEEALSPTFILAQTLEGTTLPLHHLDFYRVTKEEILAFGIQDYLLGQGAIEKGVVLIEWADRFKEIWPPAYLRIDIKILKKDFQRRISFRGQGARAKTILSGLKKVL